MNGKIFLGANIVAHRYPGDEPGKQAAALAPIEQGNPDEVQGWLEAKTEIDTMLYH